MRDGRVASAARPFSFPREPITGDLGLTAIGILLSVAGAPLLTRSMTSLLFGVGAADPLVYLVVSGLLATVALVAVAVPSSRATRVDPLAALRQP